MSTNSDDSILKFKFRGEPVHIQRKELEELGETDWFLKNLLKYEPININGEKVYEIWEDKKTVMSIYDSLRFNSLIIYPNVSLEYLLLLSEKWTVPEELIEQIKIRIDSGYELKPEQPKNSIYNLFYDIPLECIKCKSGFKLNETKKDECLFHPKHWGGDNKWLCCLNEDQANKGCARGYHVLVHSMIIPDIIKTNLKEL
tara:strand:- start:71 stop:670 length:600 start_codon:yes stop_codon:yes gene_type:complete